MQIAIQPDKQKKEVPLKMEPAESESKNPAIFQQIETKKGRWKIDVELDYDPVKDMFVDKSKREIFVLLDSDKDDQFFDDTVEVDPLEFESNNSTFIVPSLQKILELKDQRIGRWLFHK